MHQENQLILTNLYSEYLNLPWYKKIFFPRSLKAALRLYVADVENKENAFAVCNAFVNSTGFFQFWLFPFLALFKESFFMKAFIMLSNNELLDEVNDHEAMSSLVEEPDSNLKDAFLQNTGEYSFHKIKILNQAGLLTKDLSLTSFKILQDYPQINLEILKILKAKDLLTENINFANIARHTHSFTLVDIFHTLNLLDLLTVKNINKIVECNFLYAFADALKYINLCTKEKRQDVLDKLIAREDCTKAINRISDKLYSNLIENNFLAQDIITIISNHAQPCALINRFNLLSELDLNFTDKLQLLSEHQDLLILEETIKRIAIFSLNQRQELFDRLIVEEDFLKAIHYMLMYIDTADGISLRDSVNIAEKIIETFPALINQPIEFVRAILILNEANLLQTPIIEALGSSAKPMEVVRAIVEHQDLLTLKETIKRIAIFSPKQRQELFDRLIVEEDFFKAIHYILMYVYPAKDISSRDSVNTAKKIIETFPALINQPIEFVRAILILDEANLLQDPIIDTLSSSAQPMEVARAIVKYKELLTGEEGIKNLKIVIKNSNIEGTVKAIQTLNKYGLLNDDNLNALVTCNPYRVIEGLEYADILKLKENNKQTIFNACLDDCDPFDIVSILDDLQEDNLLDSLLEDMEINVMDILRHPKPEEFVSVLFNLKKDKDFENTKVIYYHALLKQKYYPLHLLCCFQILQNETNLFNTHSLELNINKIQEHENPYLLLAIIQKLLPLGLLHGENAQNNFDILANYNVNKFLAGNVRSDIFFTNELDMLFSDVAYREIYIEALKTHQNPMGLALSLITLNNNGLLKSEQGERNLNALIESTDPEMVAESIINSVKSNFETSNSSRLFTLTSSAVELEHHESKFRLS